MCANFYDVRSFGAVMSTKQANCGQIRGPVQVTFAQSVEPIVPQEITITRMAATTEDESKGDNRTMGRKHIVPYGLYRAHGFISAKLAERAGFDEEDLELLLQALAQMFDHDRSAARGEMATRKLIVFKHESALGNAPAHVLFDAIKIGRNVDGIFRDLKDEGLNNLPPARVFSDYAITIDRELIPAGVEVIERI
jgi:CRISPR-associated protein Csd2